MCEIHMQLANVSITSKFSPNPYLKNMISKRNPGKNFTKSLPWKTWFQRETLDDASLEQMFHMGKRFTSISPKFEEEDLAHPPPRNKVLQYMITSSGVQHVCMKYEHGLSDKVLLMLTWNSFGVYQIP
jgi:hypothetical protein